MKLLLASTIAVSAAAMASGCATRGDIERLDREVRALSMENIKRFDRLASQIDSVGKVYDSELAAAERRIGRIEAKFEGGWEDPNCVRYTPEAQELFRKRVIRDFDRLAEEAARKTDAYFCSKAKTEWERRAFCAPSTEKGGERK